MDVIQANPQYAGNGSPGNLVFWLAGADGDNRKVVGPAPVVRVVGSRLHVGPDGREVASYSQGVWHVRGAMPRYQLLWSESLIVVQFEDPVSGRSMTCGPFDMLGVVGGEIHVDREQSRCLARLDDVTHQWCLCESGTAWPVAVFVPPPVTAPLAVDGSREPDAQPAGRPPLLGDLGFGKLVP